MIRIHFATKCAIGWSHALMGLAGLSIWNIGNRLKIVVLTGLLVGSLAHIVEPAHAQPDASSAAQARAEPPDQAIETWRDAIAKKPIVKKGCFNAAYPDTTWREVACAAAPDHPMRSARGGGPAIVGNGNDWTAQVSSGVISSATGSFSKVIGVLNEADHGTANYFSLQLNTNTFTTPACDTAAVPDACVGWEQFVFDDDLSSYANGSAYVQYWLIGYAATCPSGWNTFGKDCWRNSVNSATAPAPSITSLAKVKITGEATVNGKDTIIVTTPGGVATAVNQDSVLSAANVWQAAEFNLFGYDGGTEADLNSGVTLEVRIAVKNGTKNPPTCVGGKGTTGEQNNLNLGSCSAVGGSSPAITFTESNPPGSIWHYTGSPCKSGKCAGWKEFDNNNESVRIASTGGNVYQLWNSGNVWSSTGAACSGGSCPGWKQIDSSGNAFEIVAGGNVLYQMTNAGDIYSYTGSAWQMLDNSKSTAVTIAAATGGLYAIHNTGNIWKYTGKPCNGSVCSGWQQLDDNTATVAIVTESSNLYQLHSTGSVWKFTGKACSGGKCTGWQMLNNNANALQIAASGGNLYELDTNGAIWKYTGTPCNGNTCTGWQMLDNNPAAMDIAADGSNLYELHNDGTLFSYTGTGAPCNATSCAGWQEIDNDAWTGRIAASNGQLYQLHVIQTPRNQSLECYDCR